MFGISEIFHTFCFELDMVIYNAIAGCYKVYSVVASARLLSSTKIQAFTTRIYLVISIIMLFIVAYSLLTIIINPESYGKGKFSPFKLVKNVIIALVAIVITPTIFSFGYALQSRIFEEDIIGKLILGKSTITSNNTNSFSGHLINNLFQNSYYLTNAPKDGDELTDAQADYDNASKETVYRANISPYSMTLQYVETGEIQYHYFIAELVGLFVLWVFVGYLFDVGLRTVKLIFYQLIAPIPCLFFVVPGQEKVFTTWIRETIKTFLEVFLRIAILMFCVMIMTLFFQHDSSDDAPFMIAITDPVTKTWASLFILIGIFWFMKKAPKLISQLFGMNSESMGFSLSKRLKASGVTATIGAAASAVMTAGSMVAGAYMSDRSNKAGLDSAIEALREKGGPENEAKIAKLQAKKGKKSTRLINYGLGAYYGARGGIKGIGTAYNSGLDRSDQAAAGMSWKDIGANMLRDNFGVQSRFEEEIKKDRIKNTALTTRLRDNNASLRRAAGVAQGKINENNDPYINANSAEKKAAEELKSHNKSELMKDGDTHFESVLTAEFVPFSSADAAKFIAGSRSVQGGIDGIFDSSTTRIEDFRDKLEDKLKVLRAAADAGTLTDEQRKQYEFIQADLEDIAAGGTIHYSQVDNANLKMITDIKDNIGERLADAGASEAQIARAKGQLYAKSLDRSELEKLGIDPDKVRSYKEAEDSLIARRNAELVYDMSVENPADRVLDDTEGMAAWQNLIAVQSNAKAGTINRYDSSTGAYHASESTIDLDETNLRIRAFEECGPKAAGESYAAFEKRVSMKLAELISKARTERAKESSKFADEQRMIKQEREVNETVTIDSGYTYVIKNDDGELVVVNADDTPVKRSLYQINLETTANDAELKAAQEASKLLQDSLQSVKDTSDQADRVKKAMGGKDFTDRIAEAVHKAKNNKGDQ